MIPCMVLYLWKRENKVFYIIQLFVFLTSPMYMQRSLLSFPYQISSGMLYLSIQFQNNYQLPSHTQKKAFAQSFRTSFRLLRGPLWNNSKILGRVEAKIEMQKYGWITRRLLSDSRDKPSSSQSNTPYYRFAKLKGINSKEPFSFSLQFPLLVPKNTVIGSPAVGSWSMKIQQHRAGFSRFRLLNPLMSRVSIPCSKFRNFENFAWRIFEISREYTGRRAPCRF